MTLQELGDFPVQFASVFFRFAGLMVFAPLIGSERIPRPVKVYLAAVLTLAMAASMPPAVALPPSAWQVAAAVGGELIFGVAAGMILSTAFIAAQWAGGVAGQQMGFNMAGNFDPRSDFGGTPLGDAYFILLLMLFLVMDGHHAMMLGVRNSFDHLPPLSAGLDGPTFDLLISMLAGATTLALRVAIPVCVAMLVVDLSLGMVGKTIPQMNLMSVGLSLRAMVGLFVTILGVGLAGYVLSEALVDGIGLAERVWAGEFREDVAS